MSNVRDRGVIDIILKEDGKYILIILDDMKWETGTRQQHARILQDKINDYLDYIASGQAEEANPGMRPVIRILAEHSYSRYCIDFLERVRAFIKNKDDICDIEWTHSSEAGPFDDGFSDDFVFDEAKIFPRLKKNLAEDPASEVSLMAPGQDASDYPKNMVMYRCMDSYIGMIMQDMGSVFTYITYDMLPEGTDVAKLQNIAFDNLMRDITYRACESKEPGIYGIVAGGDFEAESLCVSSIWQELSATLGDDLMLCVPTKDIVLYTKASDKELCKKLVKMAEETFTRNLKETPYLLFSTDILIYDRKENAIRIDGKFNAKLT